MISVSRDRAVQLAKIAVAWSAWAAVSLSVAIAAPNNGDALESYLSSQACRNAIISGGQNLTGAINFRTVSNRQPFSIFTILPGDASENGASRIKVFSPFDAHYLADLYGGVSGAARLFWSRDDDFVMWDYGGVFWLDGRSVRSAGRVGFNHIDVPRSAFPVMRGGDEAVPDHFTNAALSAGANYRDIIEFDPRSGSFADLGIPVSASGGVAWTADRTFVRLFQDEKTLEKHLQILGPDLETWSSFSPFGLPRDARLLLLRRNPVTSELEAAAVWRDGNGIGQIGIVRRGSLAPRIIATGPIERVVAAPDRSGIYGYVDQMDRFHRVRSEAFPQPVVYWLSRFETMDGVEDFHLLGDAKYSVVKANAGSAGPRVTVLERRREIARTLATLCETQSPVQRTIKTDRAILFLPTKPAGNTLVVYLHGGPRYHVNEAADHFVDLLTSQGHTVLAVNYTGSMDENHLSKSPQTIAETYAQEVGEAVEYARSQAGMGTRKVVILANSFGSIVAFSTVLSGRVAADGLLVVSGVTDPKVVLKITGSELDTAYLGYLGRAAREVRPFDVEQLIKLNPDLRLGFLHGELDQAASVSDIEDFVRRYNAANPHIRARLTVIDDMGHAPSRREEHREFNQAIREFLAD